MTGINRFQWSYPASTVVRDQITTVEEKLGGTYFHARLSTSRNGAVRIAFLGSSTTVGTGASNPDRSYVATLTRALQQLYPSGVAAWEPPVWFDADVTYKPALPGINAYNAAVSGTWSNSYVPAGTLTNLTTFQPHICVHMPAANDYRTGLFDPSQTETNVIGVLADIDAILTVPAAHIICGTYAAPDTTSPEAPWSDYLAALAAVAASHPLGAFIDPSESFVAADASGPTATDPLDLIGTDDIHATDAGHALLAQEVTRLLRLPGAPDPQEFDVIDKFRRTTLGTTETNQAWTEQSTAVHVPNGTYLTVTTLGNAVIETGFSDAEVSAMVTCSLGAVVGVITKSNSATTRIGFYLNGPNDAAELYQDTTLKSQSAALSLVAGREYHLRLYVKGDTAVGYVNGLKVCNYTLSGGDATTYGGYTTHGVRANSTSGSPKWRAFGARAL